MPQTATPTQVDTIITFVTSQAVRDQAPTTTPKFSLTSGRVDWKIIYYETNAGEDL